MCFMSRKKRQLLCCNCDVGKTVFREWLGRFQHRPKWTTCGRIIPSQGPALVKMVPEWYLKGKRKSEAKLTWRHGLWMWLRGNFYNFLKIFYNFWIKNVLLLLFLSWIWRGKIGLHESITVGSCRIQGLSSEVKELDMLKTKFWADSRMWSKIGFNFETVGEVFLYDFYSFLIVRIIFFFEVCSFFLIFISFVTSEIMK